MARRVYALPILLLVPLAEGARTLSAQAHEVVWTLRSDTPNDYHHLVKARYANRSSASFYNAGKHGQQDGSASPSLGMIVKQAVVDFLSDAFTNVVMMFCGIEYSVPLLIVSLFGMADFLVSFNPGYEWIGSWRGILLSLALVVLEFVLSVIPVVATFHKLSTIPIKVIVAALIFYAADPEPSDPLSFFVFMYVLAVTVLIAVVNAVVNLIYHTATLHHGGPCIVVLEALGVASGCLLAVFFAPAVLVAVNLVAFVTAILCCCCCGKVRAWWQRSTDEASAEVPDPPDQREARAYLSWLAECAQPTPSSQDADMCDAPMPSENTSADARNVPRASAKLGAD